VRAGSKPKVSRPTPGGDRDVLPGAAFQHCNVPRQPCYHRNNHQVDACAYWDCADYGPQPTTIAANKQIARHPCIELHNRGFSKKLRQTGHNGEKPRAKNWGPCINWPIDKDRPAFQSRTKAPAEFEERKCALPVEFPKSFVSFHPAAPAIDTLGRQQQRVTCDDPRMRRGKPKCVATVGWQV